MKPLSKVPPVVAHDLLRPLQMNQNCFLPCRIHCHCLYRSCRGEQVLMLRAFFHAWEGDHRRKPFRDIFSGKRFGAEDGCSSSDVSVSGDGTTNSPASIEDILFGGEPVSPRPSPGGLRPGSTTSHNCSAATISCLFGWST